MRIRFLSLLTLLLAQAVCVAVFAADKDAVPCKQPESSSHLAGVTSQALAALVTSNVQDFCDESTIEGVGSMNLGTDPKAMVSMMNDPDKLYAYAADRLPGPWGHSWLPNEKLREDTLYHGSFYTMGFNDEVKLLQDKPPPLTTAEQTEVKNGIQKAFYDGSEQHEYGLIDTFAGRTIACATVTKSVAMACEHDISRVRDITSQRSEFALPDANQEILINEKYREGLRLAALKLLAKVKNGGAPSGDLFSDVKDSFVVSGVSPSDAENMTWTTMGVISSTGPNYIQRALDFGGHANTPTKVALAMIAQSVPLLNQRSRGTGHFYSYPPNIKSTCDNGKPYHFWMAAYLARRIALENKNPKAATAAVFAVQKGYQFLSRTTGRNPERAFTVDTFDGFNNIMRIDMTYAAAGARFGADAAAPSLNPAPLNIDEGVKKIVQQSQITPSISPTEAHYLIGIDPFDAFGAWENRFAPDSVYQLFNP